VKEEQSLRASLPALSSQILELVKSRSEIMVKEIEESTGANHISQKPGATCLGDKLRHCYGIAATSNEGPFIDRTPVNLTL
jgi:hypothetical protein